MKVFVGSSMEGLATAREVVATVAAVRGAEPILWSEAFPPGFVTIEQIERLGRTVSAAVLVASPDDESEIRRQRVRVPRANVMLELGYFMAVLGRHRVALCCVGDAVLPSDLQGYTFVPTGADLPARIQRWLNGIPRLASDVAPMTLWHGYSGEWRVTTTFDTWRGIRVGGQAQVYCESRMFLQVTPDGRSGKGQETGTLYVRLPSCYAEFAITDIVENVTCEADGSIGIASRAVSRERTKLEGTVPQKDGFDQRLEGSPSFTTNLRLGDDMSATLVGYYQNRQGKTIRSRANVVASKF